MNLELYCHRNNLVGFDDFFKDLEKKDLIFIGEDHFSKVHEENEKIILDNLVGKEYHLVVEELSSQRYLSKKEMLSQYNTLSFSQLPSEERMIARYICQLVSRRSPLLAILGNNHLRGIGSVDKLVRLSKEYLDYAVIIQKPIKSATEGIYKRRTVDSTNYILVGELSTIRQEDFHAEELTR
ncbi:MAG: hypothetical protein ABIA37_02285 [Candidatus Woesearchaeota archaeon]